MTNLSIEGLTIIEKVGEGAMSEVYKALNSQKEPVAAKVLRHYYKDNDKYVTRLKLEASNLSLFQDERIVRFLDVKTTTDGRLALIQQLVEGFNLDQIMAKDQNVPRPVIGAIVVSEILLGLEEAHRQGVIHRDLKPENIMLTSEGRIKITDFGVAKNLESEELTLTGMVLGSPAYMSPEQADGNHHIDQRADFFSLGSILYKFATGQLPFRGQTYSALAKEVATAKPEPIEKLNPKIHPELKRIIYRALSKDPDKRYQRAYEFRFDLMKYLDLIEAPSPQKILAAYFNHDSFIDTLGEERLVSTLIERAQKAINIGQRQTGIHLLRQVLTLDPGHKKAKTLFISSSKAKINGLKGALASVIILLAMQWFGLLDNSKPKNQAKPSTVAAATIPAKIAEKIIVAEKKPSLDLAAQIPKPTPILQAKRKTSILAREKESIRPKRRLPKIANKKKPLPVSKVDIKFGNLQFKVDQDIMVFLDGKRIQQLENGLVKVKAGLHLIELIKPGFAPIKSSIMIPDGETAVINSQTKGRM